MKLITINPNNEPYYSKDFIKGFKCGAERQFEADKVEMPIWIPCSERLPKEDGFCLVTITDGEQFAVCKMPFVDSEWKDNLFEDDVLAWMPLPKPWKGADDES